MCFATLATEKLQARFRSAGPCAEKADKSLGVAVPPACGGQVSVPPAGPHAAGHPPTGFQGPQRGAPGCMGTAPREPARAARGEAGETLPGLSPA